MTKWRFPHRVLTAAVIGGLALSAQASPATASVIELPQAHSDAELVKIAQSQDTSAVSALSEGDLSRLAQLGVEDPGKATTETSFQLESLGGRPASAAEKQAFGDVMASGATSEQAAQEVSQASSGRTASGCYSAKATNSGFNVTAAKLYTQWINISYCFSGNKTTSTKITSTGGQTFWAGWSWQRTSNQGSRIQADTSTLSTGLNFVQNHFKYAVLTVGNVKDAYPCLSLDVRPTWTVPTRQGTRCGN